MAIQMPQVEVGYIPFKGGFDNVTPPLDLPPGFVRRAQNFEHDINGGYARVMGYERFSGKAAPSAAQYYKISITLTGAISVGDTVTGVTSGATATVVGVQTGKIFVANIATGPFQNPEVLNVAAAPQATTTSTASTGGAGSDSLDAQYKNLAADVYRALIAVVPGQGDILGVWMIGDVVYAWRAAAGGATTDIYKSTASGWSQVTLHKEIAFTACGATEPAEATTLTQGAVTATIKRVVLTSGSYASTTAAGRFIITTPAGGTGNFTAGAATIGAITCNLTAVQTAITLSPGGRYEFVDANFGGSVNTRRTYGADGVNKGFEFDGTIYVPIYTGMATDTPKHVTAHKSHLFFSFGASVQHSGPGTPYIWSAVLGAGELALGDTVTDFISQPGSEQGGALTIFTKNATGTLYGSSAADWNLTILHDVGGTAYTAQRVAQTLVLDDRGVTSLAQAAEFGNFLSAVVSRRITPWLNDRLGLATASCVVRGKNQYRLFFSDTSAVYVTMDGSRVMGLMPQELPVAVKCVCSLEKTDGTEAIYFGSTDGYIYQMEKGTSFDGAAIEAYLVFAFNSFRTPRTKKRYRRLVFEVSGEGYSEFTAGYELGYNTTEISQPASVIALGSVFWDTFTWDNFSWDGRMLLPTQTDMTGTAENVSIVIRSNSDYFSSSRFSGALVHYTPRRNLR